jgi:hypothetical protein
VHFPQALFVVNVSLTAVAEMGGFRIEPIGPISASQTEIHSGSAQDRTEHNPRIKTMTKITSAIAAALIASASFASVALAEGDYYEGASKASATVDHVQTGSIAQDQQNQIPAPIGRGDYYEGANRPN